MALLSPAFFLAVEEHEWISVVAVTIFYLGSGCLVLAAARLDRTGSRILRFIGSLGATSYSMYLWHVPVKMWGTELVWKLSGSSSYAKFLFAYLIGTPAWGYIMSKSIEWPFIRLRDRLLPSRSESLYFSTHAARSEGIFSVCAGPDSTGSNT